MSAVYTISEIKNIVCPLAKEYGAERDRRSGKIDSAIVEYEKGISLALKEKNTEYEIYLDNCMAASQQTTNQKSASGVSHRRFRRSPRRMS